MSQAVAKSNVAEMPQHSLIKTMAGKYGLEPNTFKATVIKTLFPSDKQNPTNEQVAAFLVVANQYNLNPFIKEIYAFPGKGGGIVPIVSIDGWTAIINRHPQYDGVEFADEVDEVGHIVAITAKIFRKDRSHPVMVTEYLSECHRNTEPWKQFPSRMLRHKALMQAARYAFGFSGIYDPDEAERIAAASGGADLAPVPIAVISEEQRIALVHQAEQSNVVEHLGNIVNSFGFDMLAHITVDRFTEIMDAIKDAAPKAIEGEGEIVIDRKTVASEPPNTDEAAERSALEAEEVDAAESSLETLRDHVKELLHALPASRQKDIQAGKTPVSKADYDELIAYQELIDAEA